MTPKEIETLCDEYPHMSREAQLALVDRIRALPDEELRFLILPGHKWYWWGAAEIIQQLGPARIECMLPHLLVWLQDVNWPGTENILQVLSAVDKAVLMPSIEETLLLAAQNGDGMWIGGISLLLERANIQKEDFSSPDIYDLLALSDL